MTLFAVCYLPSERIHIIVILKYTTRLVIEKYERGSILRNFHKTISSVLFSFTLSNLYILFFTLQWKGCRDCQDIKMADPEAETGIYRVSLPGGGPVQHLDVYCDMETPGVGWTVSLEWVVP